MPHAAARATLACAALLLLLCGARPATAQLGATTDILRGRVTGEEGEPLAGAQVEVTSLETGVRRTALTGNDGRWTVVFPDGGGRYRVRISYVGRAPYETVVARQADEDVLALDVRLAARPIALQGIAVTGRRAPPPGHGEAGSTTRGLPGDLLSRLPLENTDPATLAALAPGVVPLGGDSAGGPGTFSVAGQRPTQNNVTLDGATFASLLSGTTLGGSPLGLPAEGLRNSQVITSTYDVARGQFTGGQVALTTRGGTNTLQGSLSSLFQNSTLQGGAGRTDWAEGFQRNRASGGLGGPLRRDRLFYNLSFAAEDRADDLFNLLPRTTTGLERLGTHPDSIARFLQILAARYGTPTGNQAGAYPRTSRALSTLARIDYLASPDHTLALRTFISRFDLEHTLVRPLDLRENGADQHTATTSLVGSLTSRLGGTWIAEARASWSAQRQELEGRTPLPEGRVRTATTLEDGRTTIATLAFGGDVAAPRASREQTTELAAELSRLVGDAHRIKLGALWNTTAFEEETATNRYGTFTFLSLADLEAGRAASFTRALAGRTTRGNGWNAALYLGDAWRPSPTLQLVYGLRLEASGLGEHPRRDPEIEARFGLRTDHLPTEIRLSPRLGFTWRVSPPGRPLRLLRGGIGEFRGRTPLTLYAAALDAGRPDGEAVLSCTGAATPTPDFARYRADPTTIPTACADGAGASGATTPAPNAVAFAPDFAAPRAWRGSLGLQAAIRPALTLQADASYARGLDQYGVRDRNLAPTPRFTAEGGRPVYADPARIDPATGTIPLAASRQDPRYGHVYEIASDLASETRTLTLALNGILLPRRISFQASYTLSDARDESSFSFGGPGQGFATTPTRGDPNRPEWAPADMDRRHTLTALLGMPIGPAAELALVARASSGTPFTPRVAGDVNGDGAPNDAAFIFDPATTPDPTLTTAMRRLLETAPSRTATCLREQLGRLARRNSCRGPWTHSLDLRATLRPRLGPIGQRASLTLDIFNLAAGLDLLLHGDDRKGWGTQGLATDAALLFARGFDPTTRTFRYEVNQNFGRNLAPTLLHSPFAVQLAGRIAVGPDRGPDPLGGFAALGAAGTGPILIRQTRGPEGAAVRTEIVQGDEARAAATAPTDLLDRLIPSPIGELLALRDSLALTPDQIARLEAVRDSLAAKNDPIRAELARTLGLEAGGRDLPGENPAARMQNALARVNEARQNVQTALDQARTILTPDQWARVPDRIRNALERARIQIRGNE